MYSAGRTAPMPLSFASRPSKTIGVTSACRQANYSSLYQELHAGTVDWATARSLLDFVAHRQKRWASRSLNGLLGTRWLPRTLAAVSTPSKNSCAMRAALKRQRAHIRLQPPPFTPNVERPRAVSMERQAQYAQSSSRPNHATSWQPGPRCGNDFSMLRMLCLHFADPLEW